MYSQNLGKLGELKACEFLRKKGYRILSQNFRCKIGEIDIITQKDDVIVFVEVKTRIGNLYGTPEEAVTPWKLRSIIRTVQYYVTKHQTIPKLLRVDVIAITLSANKKVETMRHIENITG